jgi:hypothetical protein
LSYNKPGASVQLILSAGAGNLLINNYNDVIIKKQNLELQPYQAVIARV